MILSSHVAAHVPDVVFVRLVVCTAAVRARLVLFYLLLPHRTARPDQGSPAEM
jgi:hypothetical protein